MPGIDELRVQRDRAKVRLDIALLMEQQARERFSVDSTGFAAWKQAVESADEARWSFDAAQATYLKALAAVGLTT
jgi:hypothetical protein